MKRVLFVVLVVLCAITPAFAQSRYDTDEGRDSRVHSSNGGRGQYANSQQQVNTAVKGLRVYIERIDIQGYANREMIAQMATDQLGRYGAYETLDRESADALLIVSIVDELQRQDGEGMQGNTSVPNILHSLPGDIGKFIRRNTPQSIDLSFASSHAKWTVHTSVDLKFVARIANGQPGDVLLRIRGDASKQGVRASDKQLQLAFGNFFRGTNLGAFQSSDQEPSFMALAGVALALQNSTASQTLTERRAVVSFATEVTGRNIVSAIVDDQTAAAVHRGQHLNLTQVMRDSAGRAAGGTVMGEAVVVGISGRVVTLEVTSYRGTTVVALHSRVLDVEIPR